MNRKLFLLPVCMAVSLTFGRLNAQNSAKLIQDYYQKNSKFVQKNGVNDKIGVLILDEDISKSLGATIVNVQQTYQDVKVYKALGKVIIKDGKIISEKNNFERNIIVANQKTTDKNFSEDFFQQKLKIGKIGPIEYLPDVYFEKNGIYLLAKEFIISDKNSADMWNIIADAGTGEILNKYNMTISCNFENNPNLQVDNGELLAKAPEEHILYNSTKLAVPGNASYNVFALPVEAPTFGTRSVINNPWDLTASPEGWHSDGTNNYTNTRGNNVYTYSDQNNTNTPGYSPDGGSSLTFDFPFADGRNDNPFTYRDASITNLFYMNNKMHDVFYKFGFTETTRNFQTNNFGKGGIGGDAVRAEAFDGSGLSNANFYPGSEGGLYPPRMQMYLYDRKQSETDPIIRYQYNSPVSIINRSKVMTGGAGFGSQMFNGQSVTGDMVLSSPADACTALPAGSMTGKIGIAKRGTCSFASKVKKMQDAGALGAIIYDPNNDEPFTMGNDDTTFGVIIPSIMIGKTEGEYITNQIGGGTTINITLNYNFDGFKHSSFDNGIIAHEYGHGISNRLTGSGSSCLQNKEQMGEGWSDYFALMITTRPGDTSSLARGIGTYPYGNPTTDKGIRPAKYSPDFSVNDYTYARTNTAIVPHGVGFIWATMLWDLTWKYIEKYGYNSNVLASTTSGNAKALQIVIDGLKLQACNPSFIDGRNAILESDAVGNAGTDKCMIWNAFAKRGLGVNASAGTSASINDQVEDFTVPQECSTLATQDLKASDTKFIIFPNPTYDEFFVGNIDKSSKEVKIRMFDMSGKLVFTDSRESASKKAISTRGFQKGLYMVHIQQGEKTQVEKLIVR